MTPPLPVTTQETNMNDLVPQYASLNITFAGQNGDLPDPVLFDASDEQVRTMATEAVRAGGVRGLDLHATADFTDFVVDRVAAHDGLPARMLLRPKTPFGNEISYLGVTEAELLHGLYHASKPLGMGRFQHLDTFTLEDVQKELENVYKRPSCGVPHLDPANQEENGVLHLDYYHGHPFKIRLDPTTKTFDDRLFARDNGEGVAQRVIDGIKAAKAAA